MAQDITGKDVLVISSPNCRMDLLNHLISSSTARLCWLLSEVRRCEHYTPGVRRTSDTSLRHRWPAAPTPHRQDPP